MTTDVFSVSAKIARNVREMRRVRGWSVRRLADECCRLGMDTLTQASLTNLERGLGAAESGRGDARANRHVTADELYFLADLFGVTPASLVDAAACERCHDAPPAGFSCLACDKSGAV